MTTDPKNIDDVKAQTCLRLAPVNLQGRALGLAPGDLLVRLDGQPLEGPAAQLLKHAQAHSDIDHLLSLRRDKKEWSVLSSSLALGRWKAEACPDQVSASSARSERMRNWDVLVNDEGRYDAHPRRAPGLALLAPIYLIQMRLWAALAVWVALTLLGLAVGWLLGISLQLLICFYVWRAAPALFRADRYGRGFYLWRVIAANSETDLHQQVTQLAPDLTFVLSRSKPEVATSDETPMT